jgi:hypothetical protein
MGMPFGDQMGDPVGDYARFAASGTRENQQGALSMPNSLLLLRIQASQEIHEKYTCLFILARRKWNRG